MSDLLDLTNPVFGSLVFYSTLSIGKMMDMSLMTVVQRFRNRAFANPEDAGGKATKTDEAVERVRRNHLNDLENIPAFVLVGAMYVLTKPDPTIAKWHFRLFFLSRVIHTLAYQLPLPQPARALMFMEGYAITASMGVQVLMSTFRNY